MPQAPDAAPPMIKRHLRAAMNARRVAQPPAQARAAAEAAQRALMAQPCWTEARQIALYVAFKGEMDTGLLLRHAWEQGQQVLLPRCRPRTQGIMDLVLCSGPGDLHPGHFGILEPRADLPALAWDDPSLAPAVMVVPGVAFDRTGRRLGFGGGYYDRALARPALAQTARVGLAYSWQVVDGLPAEDWDCPVQCLCTEEGCTWL